ncbi:MAG TPA: EAL domain-containing protein [Candidatus Eremiobacteraceae bacterium]|nr:EAL domain-containing protein [Candidatus Eremiobacteraceae bacterium]
MLSRIAAGVRTIFAPSSNGSSPSASLAETTHIALQIAHAPVAVVGWDLAGNVAEWNAAAERIFGYTRSEAVGREGVSLLRPLAFGGRRTATLHEWTGDVETLHSTRENVTKDGRRIICEWHDTPLLADDGKLLGFTSVVTDVTDRVRMQEQLRDSEAAIRSLYEVTSAPYADFLDQLRAVLAMGSSFFRLQSGLVTHIEGQNCEVVAAQFPDNRFLSGDVLPLDRMYSAKVAADNETLVIRHASAEGWIDHPAYLHHRMESYIGTPVHVAGKTYGTISFASTEPRDQAFTESEKDFLRLIAQWLGLAIERRNVEAELRHNALHDSLTGLPNVRLLHDRLHAAIENAKRTSKPVAVCFLDLDRFKIVNDTLGHRIGDSMLKEVTQRLSSCLRESDTLARLGGDEFVILLPQVENAAAAAKVAQRMLETLSQPFVVEGQDLFATASMGVSMYPDDGADPDALIKNADHAMYRAKELGRDTFLMYSSNDEIRRERLALETALRRALKNDELLLHYQPQVDIATGSVIGIEALVRWNHPERGLVPPNDFIPLAEETGLIVPIGGWVIEQACRQVSDWKRMGFPALRVAVNVSARQFRHGSFVDSVTKVLAHFELDPSLLEIELTESATMHASDLELEALQRLKFEGVRLAIDDFGTGYASLSNLKRFPIDAVKIDRSFVRDCLNSTDDAAIVKAVVSMGHALHLQVVAEGVETREQLSFLQLLGCDRAQGFLVGRPASASEVERAMAQRWNPLKRHPTEPAA